jgi:hypothetical protein
MIDNELSAGLPYRRGEGGPCQRREQGRPEGGREQDFSDGKRHRRPDLFIFYSLWLGTLR